MHTYLRYAQFGNVLLAVCLLCPLLRAEDVLTTGEQYPTVLQAVEATRTAGGLIVVVGTDQGLLTSDRFNSARFVVHGLCPDRARTELVRRALGGLDRYGRISVHHWKDARLPYADNLVNLLIVGKGAEVSEAERNRVLAPLGSACIRAGQGWRTFRKPWPGEIDQWTHYLHGPNNNAVAQDQRVGPPRHLQWLGDPKFARSHEQLASVSAMVSAAGRLFYIVDEGLTADIRLPSHWQLVARDAFNGVILWKRPIAEWADHFRSFRSGPADLPFRLVAVEDRVYVTLGGNAPVSMLDAVTGKTLLTVLDSDRTRQILVTGDRLFMLTGDRPVVGNRGRSSTPGNARMLLAADPRTGALIWKQAVEPGTLLPVTASGDSVVYLSGKHVVCRRADTGVERWRVERPIRLAGPAASRWATPTLTARGNMVYVADFQSVTALSLDDGRQQWTGTAAQGFNSPPDLFVIDDLLWRGTKRSRGSADFQEGLNALTGVLETSRDTEAAWAYPTLAHHRCYRPKATNRYILSSRSGVEFIELDTGRIDANHWIRGTCQYGVLPCNGLLYAPPHSCACNIKTMVRGLSAMAAGVPAPAESDADHHRLDTGPAYGEAIESDHSTPGIQRLDQWTTYRHDSERSGRTESEVPNTLEPKWSQTIGGRLTAPVMARGQVFVVSSETHTVTALNSKDGTRVWQFQADARIDSPPTLLRHLVLFGSADGYVYALRALDGRLAWRFRAAPDDRLIMVRGQLESAWPVPGSVLVHEGTVWAAAGRSSYLDGGLHVWRLDPLTGKPLGRRVINSLDTESGQQPLGGVDLRGALNDILLSDGVDVYLRHLKVDFDSDDDLATGGPHLLAPTGFLDDAWWHRTYWLYASDPVCMPPRNESGWSIWPRMGNMVPAGRLLCLDEKTIYGFGRDKYPGGGAGQVRGGETYRLFAMDRSAPLPLPVDRDRQHLRYSGSGQAAGITVTERNKRYGAPKVYRTEWSRPVPLLVRALVLAGDTLCLAGPPELPELRSGQLTLEDPVAAEQAYLGDRGAALQLVAAADGKTLADISLPASPVFDGMIVAGGRIYLSLRDGSLVCYGAPDH